MSFELPPLPYAEDALAPHISAETLQFHHGKHHKKYVDKANSLTEGTEWASKSLEEIIKGAEGGVFNNCAQAWNHSFYWQCMKPGGGGRPSGELARAIDQSFGGYDKLREQLADAAATQFGSGWAWIVSDNGKLAVVKTPNAVNPLRDGKMPLLTLDVWEHAYYIDYRNARPKYIDAFLDHLVNWDFVAQNLAKAR